MAIHDVLYSVLLLVMFFLFLGMVLFVLHKTFTGIVSDDSRPDKGTYRVVRVVSTSKNSPTYVTTKSGRHFVINVKKNSEDSNTDYLDEIHYKQTVGKSRVVLSVKSDGFGVTDRTLTEYQHVKPTVKSYK